MKKGSRVTWVKGSSSRPAALLAARVFRSAPPGSSRPSVAQRRRPRRGEERGLAITNESVPVAPVHRGSFRGMREGFLAC